MLTFLGFTKYTSDRDMCYYIFKTLYIIRTLFIEFSAEKLNLAINGDVKNDGTFSTVIQNPKDACGYLTCPVQALERRLFDVDLMLDKTATVSILCWSLIIGHVRSEC